ncbi:hypothetical protein [Acuticoccus sediminis]|uniref:hypothetical protein n=1 Tax=Acuticoccus sediminis TaxID=2184697 RepID=UPI0013911174|nr:hypothetical protein [Acuticoccus sediminis]
MRRPHLLALSVVAAGACVAVTTASAQTYSSALPLTVAERRALESRLSTVLDYARDNQVAYIELPGGGQAAVRAYRTVRGGNGQPCRGYRIDVDGQAGRSAVDGYRCRTPDGAVWVLAQPELRIAQQGAPLDLRRPAPQPGPPPAGASDPGSFAERMRQRLGNGSGNAPFNPNAPSPPPEEDNASLFAPGEVPPIPREAPPRDTASTGDGSVGGTGDLAAAAPGDAAPDASPATPSDAGGPTDTTSLPQSAPSQDTAAGEPTSDTFAPSVQARLATDRAARQGTPPGDGEPAAPAEASPRVVTAKDPQPAAPSAITPAPATDGTRVVAGRTDPAATTSASDERVVAALKELDYLGPSDGDTPGAVEAAIGDFASDERFALPVPSDALLARLNDALDRTGSLPICQTGAQSMCISPD